MEGKMKNDKRNATVVLVVMITIVMMFSLCACGSEVQKSDEKSYSMNVETQTSEFYVNDFANLFTDAQKQSMIQAAKEVDEKWGGIQVVVTTVESLGGATAEQYATSMYNQYGIGEDDMGVLILLSTGEGPGDRDIRIETGDKMQMYLTDGYSGTELIDNYGMPYFENDDLAGGVIAIQEATISFIKDNIDTDWNAK
jgi:uncharacterized membrane protein YgcG